MPEIGFHYFPSPENDDDLERIAYLYLYLCEAIAAWEELSGELFPNPQRRFDTERNAIQIFREFRDALDKTLDTGNWSFVNNALSEERLKHAFAYLALYADQDSLTKYERMICPDLMGKDDSEFETVLWKAEWNADGVRSPADVTRTQVERARFERAYEGIIRTDRRIDPILKSKVLRRIYPAFRGSDGTFEFDPSVQPIEPLLKAPSDVRARDFFNPVTIPFSRAKIKHMFQRAGVRPQHASFGVRIIFDGDKQKDNPTAWKAIYRKRQNLPPDLQRLLAPRMRQISFSPQIQ